MVNYRLGAWVHFGLAAALASVLTGCDAKDRRAVEERKVEYLAKHDPGLKALRERLRSQIQELDGNRDKLAELKRGFTQNSAKELTQTKMDTVTAQRDELVRRLAQIDEQVEKAMLAAAVGGDATPSVGVGARAELVRTTEAGLSAARASSLSLDSQMGGGRSSGGSSAGILLHNGVLRSSGDAPERRLVSADVPVRFAEPAVSVLKFPAPMKERYRVCNVAAGDFLVVRDQAGVSSSALARIPRTASGLEVVGGPVANGETQWVLIQFGRLEGFVNAEFLTLCDSPVPWQTSPGPVASATLRAFGDYPQLRVRGSELNVRLIAGYQRWKVRQPSRFGDPSWPLALAREVVAER